MDKSQETSLILLKPDCVESKNCGNVISVFEIANLKIRACKTIQLDDAILKEHYSHVSDLPFFPEIVAFMKSTPVIALAIAGENAINRIRDLLGPTDSTIAEKGTIRGDYGTDKMKNIAHASDSPENAEIEINRFFKKEEIV